MAAKRLSLADRIRENRKNNRPEEEKVAEQELVSKITPLDTVQTTSPSRGHENFTDSQTTTKKDQDHIRIISGSEQDHITKGSDIDQVSIRSLSDKDQEKRSPKDHHKITDGIKPKSISMGSPSASLSKSQTKIYLWFKDRGQTGVFNKPEIERSLSMPYITIRKAIKKLESIGILKLQYDNCQKVYEYRIENEQNIKLSKNIPIGSGSYQDQNNIISPSLNSSSSYIKKTTTKTCTSETENIISEIMDSDPEYTYWQEQHVIPKQVHNWKKEFGLDLQEILNNLCFVRWQILKQGADIKKSPANYIYGIMKRNGGVVNKPTGYKSMAQMDLEYYEDWKKQKKDQIRKINAIKAEALKNEIEPKLNEILENLDIDNKYVKAAIANIRSKKRKQSIATIIQSGKSLNDTEKQVFIGYLEKILIDERM